MAGSSGCDDERSSKQTPASLGRGSFLERLALRRRGMDSSSISNEDISGTNLTSLSKSSKSSADTSNDEEKNSGENLDYNQKIDNLTITGQYLNLARKVAKNMQPTSVYANLFKILTRKSNCKIYIYSAKFNPPVESKGQRFLRIHKCLNKLDNIPALFTGTTLYCKQSIGKSFKLEDTQLDFVAESPLEDVHSLHSLALKEIFTNLGLVRLGKDYFDLSNPVEFESHGLQIFSGFRILVNRFADGHFACLDICHKVIRTESVYDKLTQFIQNLGKTPKLITKAINDEIIGSTVITRYNNKTYTVLDIDFNSNPESEFTKSDGTKVSFGRYMKSAYPSISVRDMQQPMLLCKAKNGNSVYLIPELCYLTGLTETMQKNFNLMKVLSEKLKVSPASRNVEYTQFCKLVYQSAKAREIFDCWHLDLEKSITELRGKLVRNVEVRFGDSRQHTVNNADFGQLICKEPPLLSVDLSNWAIVFNGKNSGQVQALLTYLHQFAPLYKMRLTAPLKIEVRSDRIEHKLEAIKKLNSEHASTLQIVVVLLEHAREDYYNVIKQLCYCRLGLPSQVILAKTLLNKSKVKNIVAKIMLQINCKIGGQLWTLFNRRDEEDLMICGIDVYHQRGKASVIGLVSSMNSIYTSWYSKSSIHNFHSQEISGKLEQLFTDTLIKYYSINNRFPQKILVYRDGVGQGRLDSLCSIEMQQIKRAFEYINSNTHQFPSAFQTSHQYTPQLTIVVVHKRINLRLFHRDKTTGMLTNSNPGTIVDVGITNRNYTNFFLVPQSTRQGTTTPTHYIVINDEINMPPEVLQAKTYHLCYMYCNWPGSIRVPAPCQYAHRLAYKVGENLNALPVEKLNDNLFYL